LITKGCFFILGGLLAILLLTIIVKIPKERSTLKSTLVDIDTAEVVKIIITPKASAGKPFEFVRENNKWTVRQDNIVSVPMKGGVDNIFREVLAIGPQSLAAVGKAAWEEYELTDSLATRVKLLNGRNKDLAELMIGKFTYRQVSNPYAGYGGNNIEGTTYVRLSGEEEIYTVEGFLAFSFSGGFNDWRDKSLLKCKKRGYYQSYVYHACRQQLHSCNKRFNMVRRQPTCRFGKNCKFPEFPQRY